MENICYNSNGLNRNFTERVSLMNYFYKYVSNTSAAGGSQSWFGYAKDNVCRGRIYYRVFSGGSFDYSFLFSNTIDSTFSDGLHSHVNLVCDEWELLSASVGVVDSCGVNEPTDPVSVTALTFNGAAEKTVAPGEYFSTDPIEITADSGSYLCLEMTYRGRMIPCHPESVIPAFVFDPDEEKWNWKTELPFPSMVGCTRNVRAKLGFIGDSITQGCGTYANSYTHWGAYLADMLGDEYSYWNLGLGYARASDAASDGTWLFKAKQLDGISVCFGVNDILRGHTAEQIKNDLTKIVDYLQAAGVRVLIQTVPPFSYEEQYIETWNDVNDYIRGTLSKRADAFFDNVPVLYFSEKQPHMAAYGPHPNADGGLAWASALLPVMKEFAKKL